MTQQQPPRPNYAYPRKSPCPICGGVQFAWGTPTSGYGVWFKPEDSGLFAAAKGLEARACNYCGNVQLFLKNFDREEL